MLIFYPFAHRHKQSNRSLSHAQLQCITQHSNYFFVGAAGEEIVCFHSFDSLIDLLQFEHILLFRQVDGICAVDDGVDGVFEVDKKVLLRILTQQHLLDHIMVEHLAAQLFIHPHQLANHLLLDAVHQSLEVQQLLIAEIETQQNRELVIKRSATALVFVVFGRDVSMYIWLPFAHRILTLQSTKALNTRLQKMGFAYSLCAYHEGEVVAGDSASGGSRVEEPNQEVVEF